MENKKIYNLEERTLVFGQKVLSFVNKLPKNQINLRLTDQFIRSGTSLGANYREANETETKKDFLFRVRICRKEAKETIYWLDLITFNNQSFSDTVSRLRQECTELVKIFAAIIEKSR